MRWLVLCAVVVAVVSAAETNQQPPKYIEEQVADKLKAGIDAAASEITEFREGVRNLKEGAERKISDAAKAVERVGDNAKNVVIKAEHQVGSAVTGVKQGVSNAYHGALDAVGERLVEAGRTLQRDGSQKERSN